MDEEPIGEPSTNDNKMFKMLDDNEGGFERSGKKSKGKNKSLKECGMKSVDKGNLGNSDAKIGKKKKKAPIKVKNDSSDDDFGNDPLLDDYAHESKDSESEDSDDERMKNLAKQLASKKNAQVNSKGPTTRRGNKNAMIEEDIPARDHINDIERSASNERRQEQAKKIANAPKLRNSKATNSETSTPSNSKEPKKRAAPKKKPSTVKAKASIAKSTSSHDSGIQLPLSGLTMVVTGEYECCDNREELIEVLKNLGAKITGSVSGKTSILVAGHKLIDGRQVNESKKYKDAVAKNVKIITEDKLQEFLSEKCDGQDLRELLAGGSLNFALATIDEADEMRIEIKEVAIEVKRKAVPQASGQSNPGVSHEYVQNTPVGSELWTTKYAPKTLGQIMGNADIVKKLRTWLEDWEDVNLRGNKKEVKMGGGRGGWGTGNFSVNNLNAKCALLSGPPGIGKTTLARLLAQELDFTLVEQNASDIRNKKAVTGFMCAVKDNQTFSNAVIKKTLIIMDECDGMSSDRGGSTALLDTIKSTKVPIICVCNDRQHPKMRTLANHCYDLRFSRPNKTIVIKRIKQIADAERLKVDDNSIDFLIGIMGNDIRQCLNFLQIWSKKSKTFVYASLKPQEKSIRKDEAVMISNFDAGTRLMRRGEFEKMTLRERMNMFFVDYSLIPLLFHENYL
jgi:replication factor C subunit 1